MGKLSPTTRFNQCPLCQDIKGKCRITPEMILCSGYPDQDSPVAGYKFLKPAKDQFWGIHVVDDGKQFDRDRWQEQQQQRRLNYQRELKSFEQNCLPIPQRDKNYRRLARYLGLSQSDRQNLLVRGLSEDTINRYPFFSVDGKQEVPLDIPWNLPGIKDNALITSGNGFFCPSFDLNGKVNGGQVRYNVTDGNKYKWLKGSTSSHLAVENNKELPITFLKGQSDTDTLYLIEGILKPLICANKFGIEVSGAAGGNFSGSPNQFQDILNHREYKQIVLVPDGGDILNPQVMQRWQRQIEFIQSTRLSDRLLVAWWRQNNKSDGDLDEITLEKFNQIELISIREFLGIAQQHGFKFPQELHSTQSTLLEPDPIAYQEYLKEEKEREEIEEAIATERKVYRFKDWLNKGIRKEAKKKAKKLSKDNPFMVGKSYQGNRAKNLIKAIADGYNPLDNSFMGDGKSHAVLEIENNEGNIIYLAKDHRNPSIKEIEDKFTDIMPRTQWGFYIDNDGRLKEANREIEEKYIIIKPNCIRGDIFKNLKNKGYSVESEGDEINPICGNCPLLGECSKKEGLYKYEKKKALEAKRKRAHIDSLPRDKDYSKDIIIIDEPTLLLDPTQSIISEWDKLLIELDRIRENLDPDQFSILDQLCQKIKLLFKDKSGLDIPKEDLKEAIRYGAKHKDIMAFFDSFTKDNREQLEKILMILESLQYDYLLELFGNLDRENIASINQFEHEKRYQELKKALSKEGIDPQERKALSIEFNQLEKDRDEWKARLKIANSLYNSLKNTDYIKAVKDRLESAPPNALINILKALLGDDSTALRINNYQLLITIFDKDKYAFLANAKLIFLDSTIDPDYLNKIFPMNRPLKVIHREIEKPLKNLEIFNINCEGLSTNNPTDTAINRARLITRDISNEYGDTPLISNKKTGERLDIDGYYFRDNIGSNQFEGSANLAYLGCPSPNKGAIQDHYQAIYGSLEGFTEYYQRKIKEQIFQAIGRQRCLRYPDRQFKLFWIATDLHLDFLKDYGCKIINQHSLEYHHEAGSPSQVAKIELLKGISEMMAKGIKITQKAIADHIGKSRQAISKLLKNAGVTLSKLVKSARKVLSTPSIDNLIEGVDRNYEVKQLRLFLELDPIAIATECLEHIKAMGWDDFEQLYLSSFPKPVLARIMAVLLALTDEEGMILDPSPPE